MSTISLQRQDTARMARGDSESMIELTTNISMRSSSGKRPMGTDEVGFKLVESNC